MEEYDNEDSDEEFAANGKGNIQDSKDDYDSHSYGLRRRKRQKFGKEE